MEDIQESDIEAPVEPIDIPIEVAFHIGTTRLSYDTLMAWEPGQVIDLQQVPEDLDIRITANGQPIATGELMMLSGRLGVRVKETDSHG